MAVTFFTEGT